MRFTDFIDMEVFRTDILQDARRLRDLYKNLVNVRTLTMKSDDVEKMLSDLLATLRINQSAISPEELTDEELVLLHAIRSAKRGTFSSGVVNAIMRDQWWPYDGEEADLQGPVAKYLLKKGWRVFAEVRLGAHRADLVGVKWEGVLKRNKAVAIELKASLSQWGRGFGQVAEFRRDADSVYVAMTPGLLFEATAIRQRSGDIYDLPGFEEKFGKTEAGLLIVPMYETEGRNPPPILSPPPEDRMLADVKRILRTVELCEKGQCQELTDG